MSDVLSDFVKAASRRRKAAADVQHLNGAVLLDGRNARPVCFNAA
jgi:hypothetical protein